MPCGTCNIYAKSAPSTRPSGNGTYVMSTINPGFAGTDTDYGGGSDLDQYIADFFSGAWLPDGWSYGDWVRASLIGSARFVPPGPDIDRRDNADPTIPVGPPNLPPGPPEQGVQLPDVGAQQPTFPIPGSNDMTEAEWMAIYHPELVYVGPGAPAPAIPPNLQQPGEPDMHGDFLENLGELGLDWLADLVGGEQPTYPGQDFPTPAPTIPNPGTPGVPSAVCATGASPVWKKVCGVYKWVHPKRRRRRALLTESDYNALLRIEGLKVNKNMTVAIAKALTR